MFYTIKLFFIEYWLHIKRKLNLSVLNIKLLHYHISQQTIKMICVENFYYPSTQQAVNKVNYIHVEKIYLTL